MSKKLYNNMYFVQENWDNIIKTITKLFNHVFMFTWFLGMVVVGTKWPHAFCDTQNRLGEKDQKKEEVFVKHHSRGTKDVEPHKCIMTWIIYLFSSQTTSLFNIFLVHVRFSKSKAYKWYVAALAHILSI